jgi:hypothetical protein
MTERVEQQYCIKFCQKLGDSKAETIRKIQQSFGDDVMGAEQSQGAADFFYYRGIVHHSYAPEGQTINK